MSFYKGEMKYYEIQVPDIVWQTCYATQELLHDLQSIEGQRIVAIMVNLDSYLEALSWHVNRIDLTYLGQPSLIFFENNVLQLDIYVEGMIRYRVFPVWEVKRKSRYGIPPDDIVINNRFYFDVADHRYGISFNYTNTPVHKIIVKGTNSWGFSQSWFDSQKAKVASRKNDLPTEIVLCTENCSIRFVGDEIENYWVLFESPEMSRSEDEMHPNTETREAIAEAEAIMKHPKRYISYTSAEELFADLETIELTRK